MLQLRRLLDKPWSATLCSNRLQSRWWLQNTGYLLCKEYSDNNLKLVKGKTAYKAAASGNGTAHYADVNHGTKLLK